MSKKQYESRIQNLEQKNGLSGEITVRMWCINGEAVQPKNSRIHIEPINKGEGTN